MGFQVSGMMGESAALTSPLLLVKKLNPYATLRYRSDADDAGCMLYSAYDLVVPSCGKCIVKTDIAIAVPEGTYARIAPRSGLASRHHLQVGNSVTGPGYGGHVALVLFNHASEDFKISRGDEVAQLVLERFVIPKVVQVPGLPARAVYSPHGRDGIAPSTHPTSAAPLSTPSSTTPLPALSSTALSSDPLTSSTTPLSVLSLSFTLRRSRPLQRQHHRSWCLRLLFWRRRRLRDHPGLNKRRDSVFEMRGPSDSTASVLRCSMRSRLPGFFQLCLPLYCSWV